MNSLWDLSRPVTEPSGLARGYVAGLQLSVKQRTDRYFVPARRNETSNDRRGAGRGRGQKKSSAILPCPFTRPRCHPPPPYGRIDTRERRVSRFSASGSFHLYGVALQQPRESAGTRARALAKKMPRDSSRLDEDVPPFAGDLESGSCILHQPCNSRARASKFFSLFETPSSPAQVPPPLLTCLRNAMMRNYDEKGVRVGTHARTANCTICRAAT